MALIYVCVQVCVHACICVSTCVHTYVCVSHACVNVCMCLYICVNMQVCVRKAESNEGPEKCTVDCTRDGCLSAGGLAVHLRTHTPYLLS